MVKRISYVLGRAVRMDYRQFFQTVGLVHGISGKGRLRVMLDIIACGFRYGAGFNDYLLCEFYNLTKEQRATYVTRRVNNALVSLLNDKSYYHIFDNKSEFYTAFQDHLGREWLNLETAGPEELAAFLRDRRKVMVKPNSESGGKGVAKLASWDLSDPQRLYRSLRESGADIVEDVIVQHPAMAALNPSSTNTLRVVTIINEQGPHVLYAHIRIGNSDRPVDNLHSGGMFSPIDLDTGKIQYPAYDKARNTYTHHPRTGVELQGYQIPYWRETRELCLKAALVVPQMRYVGWDVAITERGPIFVEGNNLPGYDILQMPPHTPDKIGMLPRFREFVTGI